MTRLQTILPELSIPPPDTLKLDVQGFEYCVTIDVPSGSIRARQLLVELHHGKYGIDLGDIEISVACLKEEAIEFLRIFKRPRILFHSAMTYIRRQSEDAHVHCEYQCPEWSHV